jgi:hypothetical protein
MHLEGRTTQYRESYTIMLTKLHAISNNMIQSRKMRNYSEVLLTTIYISRYNDIKLEIKTTVEANKKN